MKLDITQVAVWACDLEDQPGQLAAKLDILQTAGINLEFVIARQCPDKPGHGVVFVTPIKGKKKTAAAEEAGFHQTDSLHSVRIEAKDKEGLGATLTQALAQAGINLRGFSGAALDKRAVMHFAFHTEDDAEQAISVLKKLSK